MGGGEDGRGADSQRGGDGAAGRKDSLCPCGRSTLAVGSAPGPAAANSGAGGHTATLESSGRGINHLRRFPLADGDAIVPLAAWKRIGCVANKSMLEVVRGTPQPILRMYRAPTGAVADAHPRDQRGLPKGIEAGHPEPTVARGKDPTAEVIRQPAPWLEAHPGPSS